MNDSSPDSGGPARPTHTWLRGPSDPPRLADGPSTAVEIDIDAVQSAVWPFLVDINFGSVASEEFNGARWADGVDQPKVGAEFTGSNTHTAIGTWEVQCFVHRYVELVEFGWVTSNLDDPGAQWCFELSPAPAGTHLRYSLVLGPGPSGLTRAIERMPDKEPRILVNRLDEHHRNMVRVVEAIKAAAEAPPEALG